MLSFSKSLSSKCTMEMTVHVSQGCWLRKCMRMVLVHNSWWWIRALRWDSHPLSSLHLCCSSYAHTFILRPGWLGSKRPHLPASSWLGSFQVQRQFLVLWFFFFTVHHTRGTADEWQNYKFGEETKIKKKKNLTIKINLRFWKLHWLLFTWLYRTLSFVSF